MKKRNSTGNTQFATYIQSHIKYMHNSIISCLTRKSRNPSLCNSMELSERYKQVGGWGQKTNHTVFTHDDSENGDRTTIIKRRGLETLTSNSESSQTSSQLNKAIKY